MEYIHVRSLEKYHPKYKDRTLQWAKIYFKMVQGDPDCDLIDNEIDWGRLIKIILLELEAQRPLPNVDAFWTRKGFDLDNRPMSLTIQMLHNFLVVSTQLSHLPCLDKDKDKDKEEENCSILNIIDIIDFETLFVYWEQNKTGEKYKNNESRGRMLQKLKTLTANNLAYAKEVIVHCVDSGYKGFCDGAELYYKRSNKPRKGSEAAQVVHETPKQGKSNQPRHEERDPDTIKKIGELTGKVGNE